MHLFFSRSRMVIISASLPDCHFWASRKFPCLRSGFDSVSARSVFPWRNWNCSLGGSDPVMVRFEILGQEYSQAGENEYPSGGHLS